MKPMKINTNSIFKTALSLAAVVLFGTQASAQCSPPTGPVVISNIQATNVTATWSASSDDPSGAQYEWEVRLNDASSPGSGNEVVNGFTENGVYSTIASTLDFSTSYVFYVRYNCDEDPLDPSIWINSAAFTTATLATPLATPATSVTDVSLNANWNPVAGADNYFFDLSTSSDFSTYVGIYENFSTTATSLSITGLSPNTIYYYRVRAFGDNGTIAVTTPNSNVISRSTLGPASSTYTWEGPFPGHWEPADGEVDITKDVIINFDYDMNLPEVSSFEAKNMFINDGFEVTITDNNYIRLQNSVFNYNANNEGLTVKSGGNFRQDFNGVNFNQGGMKVERESAAIYRLDYTIWSSPASGKPGEIGEQTLLDFSPQTLTNRFYTYNSGSNLFSTVNPATTLFEPGQGYLIRVANTHPDFVEGESGTSWLGTFEGPINGGTYSIPSSVGFNMIGNPYPSQLSLDQFFDEEANPGLTGTAYLWRRKNNTEGTGPTQAFYATYTIAGGTGTPGANPVTGSPLVPDAYVVGGQGFLVESTTGDNILFTNAMREHDVAFVPFFRSNVEKNRYWLNVSYDGAVYNEMLVAYLPVSTNALDRADGKFFGEATIALTSLVNNEEYVIQGRAPFTVTDVVPLHFRASATGNFTIGFDRADGIFNGDQNIYLKDNVTNIVHDIKASDYTFAAVAGVYADRFEIVYTNSLSVGSPVFDANAVVVYKQNGAIQINAGNTIMSDVKVFDIRGRLVAQKNNVNATETSLVAGAENQVLIIQISSENNGVVSKKFIN